MIDMGALQWMRGQCKIMNARSAADYRADKDSRGQQDDSVHKGACHPEVNPQDPQGRSRE